MCASYSRLYEEGEGGISLAQPLIFVAGLRFCLANNVHHLFYRIHGLTVLL